MLVIRMQRVGRKGHAQFRVVVQDSRRTPTSGKVVARLGSFDPHSKNVNLDKERAQHFLDHGAQPTPRVVRLLKTEKVKLPKWVSEPKKQAGSIKNPEKLRKNRPEEPKEEAPAEAAENEASSDEASEVATGEPQAEATSDTVEAASESADTGDKA